MRPLVAACLACALATFACAKSHDRPGPLPPFDGGGVTLPGDSTLRVHAIDPATGEVIPCRVSIEGIDGTASPLWSGDTAFDDTVGAWVGASAVAVSRTVAAMECDFSIPLRAGRYRVAVTYGLEREAHVEEIQTLAGRTVRVDAELRAAVDTAGWACADFHIHSMPSWDTRVPLDQRLVAAVAEGLDAIVPTDHDRMGAWSMVAVFDAVSERLLVVPGVEVTPDSWGAGLNGGLIGHFNVYPLSETFDPVSLRPTGGGAWELGNVVRREVPGALLQVNHPRWNATIGYFDAIQFDPILGTGRLEEFATEVDVIEVWNGHELDAEDGPALDLVLEDWFSLLDRGLRVFATANSDTHRLAKTPVGAPRTCIEVRDDTPGRLTAGDLVESLRAGRAFMTSGPWLRATIRGAPPGSDVVATGDLAVEVAVDAPAHVPVDWITVYANGEAIAEVDVERLDVTTSIPLAIDRDAWIVVAVEGDGPVPMFLGDHVLPMRSLAFTNPFFVDRDGDGSWRPPVE